MLLKLMLGLMLVTAITAQTAEPVKASVYYESLCPDSKNFIANQLWPTYQAVSAIFVVEFVPFGFSNYTQDGTSWDFTCQHGPDECYGNKIHSCALNYYPDNSQSVPFISCSMSAEDSVAACEDCANQVGLDWQKIYDCANSDLGSQLLHDNGVKTQALDPSVTWVPWIIINDVFTAENEVLAETNFLKLICDTYTGTLPPECTA